MLIDWEDVARTMQFENPQKMLSVLYVEQGKTVYQIGEITKISPTAIRQALANYCQIEFRPVQNAGRGRMPGKFVCRWCHEESEGDVRNVCCQKPECRAKESDMIRKIKCDNTRRRIAQKSKNPCKICGHDKGNNRWYCRECLSAIASGSMFD